MTAKFEIFRDTDEQFRVRLKSASGEIIGSSEAYPSKQGAESGIEAMKSAVATAETVDLT